MAVDQVDRAIYPLRHTSPGGRVGHSIGRAGRGAIALTRRIVGYAFGLVENVVEAVPSVLRSAARTAGALVSRVVDAALLIVHRVADILRPTPTRDERLGSVLIGPQRPTTTASGDVQDAARGPRGDR